MRHDSKKIYILSSGVMVAPMLVTPPATPVKTEHQGEGVDEWSHRGRTPCHRYRKLLFLERLISIT